MHIFKTNADFESLVQSLIYSFGLTTNTHAHAFNNFFDKQGFIIKKQTDSITRMNILVMCFVITY
jgi:hypothetical protein